MKTSELRKQVCRQLKAGELSEVGNKPKQPSKVIYNLKAEQLNKILDSGKLNWNELQEVISHIWAKDADKNQDKNPGDGKQDHEGEGEGESGDSPGDNPEGDANGDAEGDAEGDADGDGDGEMPKIPEMPSESGRQYVTTTGTVPTSELYTELGLKLHEDSIKALAGNFGGAMAKMDKISKLAENAVKIAEENTGNGEIKISVGNNPVIKLKNEHLHPAFERILFHLKLDKNVYLYGSAGAGKTTSAIQAKKALGLDKMACYSCTAGMSESLLTGRLMPNVSDGSSRFLSTEFVDIWENGGLILLDEFDAIDGNCAVVLNSALANGFLHVPNRTENPTALRHKDCYVLGAGNTDGSGNGSRIYSGRNKLDGATLDRFTAIRFEYDEKLEKKLSGGHKILVKALKKLRKNVSEYEISRIISTRAFQKCATWLSAGNFGNTVVDVEYCLKTICESWTEFEIDKTELSAIVKDAKAVESVKVS